MFARHIIAAGILAAAVTFMPAAGMAEEFDGRRGGPGQCEDGRRGDCGERPHHGGHHKHHGKGSNVNIGIGIGYGYGYGYGYGDGYPGAYVYDAPRLSCGESRHRVREYGFRKVVTRSCGRRVDSFSAWKNGRRWVVEVGKRSGNVRVMRW